MISNETHSNCIIFHLGYCHHEHFLLSIYIYICLVSLTLVILMIVLSVYVRHYTAMVRRGDGALFLSLLVAHLLDNIGILGLNVTYIVHGTVPKFGHVKYYRLIRMINFVCTILETIVSSNIFVLTLERFLAIYLSLRYGEWFTRTKQNVMLVGVWGGPLAFAGILIALFHRRGDKQAEVMVLLTVVLTVNIITLTTVFFAHAYILKNLRKHLRVINHNVTFDKREQQRKITQQKKKKAFEMSFCIILCFMVAYSVDAVVKVTRVNKARVPDEMILATSYLFTINSLCNAIIYVASSRRLRKHILEMLRIKTNQ